MEGVETLGLKQELDSTLFLCPKLKNMATQEVIHIGHLIKEVLAEQGRSVSWLAAKVGCTRQNMYYSLNRAFIYTDLLLKISNALDYDFFKCYSDYRNARLSKNV